MQELSVCQALLEQVQNLAQQHGAASVYSIVVQIGPLSGVEPELLEQAYGIARSGTAAADARLIIENGATRVWCSGCQSESEVAPRSCTSCFRWTQKN